MNLSRCENGHFYDKEKFPTCPHCGNGLPQDEGLTSVFTEDLDAGFVTAPLDETAARTAPQPASLAPTEALVSPGGIAAAPVMDATETLGASQMQNLNFSTESGMEMEKTIGGDEDDDHTVAFYDDLFLGAQPAAAPTQELTIPMASHRLTSPCVGWLIAISGTHLGQDFRLKAGKNFIGRDTGMDVVLDGDKSVSRNKHAIVVYEPKHHLYMVQSGESSELVYLNNELVLNPAKLSAYDMITVGEVNLLFIPLCGETFNWNDILLKKQNEE